jgi:hypothetical protein
MTQARKPPSSPTFIAGFVDDEVTRMTIRCSLDKLNVRRGVRLSQWAYQSRMKCEPPAIIEASFVINNKTLATYDAAALKKVNAP